MVPRESPLIEGKLQLYSVLFLNSFQTTTKKKHFYCSENKIIKNISHQSKIEIDRLINALEILMVSNHNFSSLY